MSFGYYKYYYHVHFYEDVFSSFINKNPKLKTA